MIAASMRPARTRILPIASVAEPAPLDPKAEVLSEFDRGHADQRLVLDQQHARRARRGVEQSRSLAARSA